MMLLHLFARQPFIGLSMTVWQEDLKVSSKKSLVSSFKKTWIKKIIGITVTFLWALNKYNVLIINYIYEYDELARYRLKF